MAAVDPVRYGPRVPPKGVRSAQRLLAARARPVRGWFVVQHQAAAQHQLPPLRGLEAVGSRQSVDERNRDGRPGTVRTPRCAAAHEHTSSVVTPAKVISTLRLAAAAPGTRLPAASWSCT